MRILVTGAGGFLGSHVASRLSAAGHQVTAAARTRSAADSRLTAADLAQDALEPLIEGCEAVVHCAARASPWGDRSVFWRDNVVATERLLAAAQGAGTVRRFVHISSPSIYFNFRDANNIREAFTAPRHWPTFYAESKWESECRVRAAPELGPIILRPRAVFGPRDRAIVPRLVAAARGGWIPVPNGGRARIDITYVDNVVTAIEQSLTAGDELHGRAFNLTNGESLSVKDMLVRLFQALKLNVRLVSVPLGLGLFAARVSEAIARRRTGRPEPRLTMYGMGLMGYSQTLCIEAARTQLRYQPEVSIDEGLQRFARWWAAR